MSSLGWHRVTYSMLRVLLAPFLKKKLNYTYEKVDLKNKQYIVLANHNTDYDPLLVGLTLPHQIYYVASEHIFRWGLISSFIKLLVDPIPRVKATTEISTVMEIFRKLKAGANVCLFAEGNRSFSGETGEIHPSTAKLIKRSGVALITFRIDGGYFTSPRWSKTLRKGAMTGSVVKEYSPEELKNMSAKEVSQVIERDLYVNAYEEQEKNPIAYKGKNLAESLETALYLCPKCRKIASFKSEDDRFCCSCGIDLKYNEYGMFTSNNESQPIFSSVLDWVRWQFDFVKKDIPRIKKLSNEIPIYFDENQTLWKADRNKNTLLSRGKLVFYNNRLVFEGENEVYTFLINEIADIEIIGQMVIAFATNDRQAYEIKSNFPRSALKYRDIFKLLKE